MLTLRQVHSLTSFLRNHKEHMERLKKTQSPEVLTVNGRAELVVQNAEGYQDLLDRLEYAENVVGLRTAFKQGKEGLTIDLEDAFRELRTKHGS